MRAGLTGRVDRLRASVPEGCAACRSWPHARFLVDDEAEPPTVCGACGWQWHGLTRVHVVLGVESGAVGGYPGR